MQSPDSKIRFQHERRMNDMDFRVHVYSEIDAIREKQSVMESKLDEVLSILRATKIGAWIIKWLSGIAVAGITIWALVHDKRVP